MSNKYSHGSEVPSDVLCKRLEELSNSKNIIMRIPAEVDYDADLVLSEAAIRIEKISSLRAAIMDTIGRYTDVQLERELERASLKDYAMAIVCRENANGAQMLALLLDGTLKEFNL